MTDLVTRLREAIDAEEADVDLSISIEIESLRADGGTVMTREEILGYDADEEGGGPYTRRLRRCAADRKILDRAEMVLSAGPNDLDANGRCYSDPIARIHMRATVADLAEAYGVEA